jgi:C-terminal processing protease CtpA/Prc
MLNLDMVGRLRQQRVTVFGTRSAEPLNGIVREEAARLGLTINDADGPGRSDHVSFTNKGIPALHFFTGIHADYHRPGDSWDKLNADGMATIASLVAATVTRIAKLDVPLVFTGSAPRAAQSDAAARGYGAYLGTIPDFSGGTDGVRVAGTANGSPAALAGLREGDVIVRFAGYAIQSLEDLTIRLREKMPGDEVEILVLRSGQTITLKAILRPRG